MTSDDLDPRAELPYLAGQARGLLELDRLLGVTCSPVPALPPLARRAPPPAAPAKPAPAPVVADPGLDAVRKDHEAKLEALARRMAGCTRCRLSEGRTQLVFGQGDAAAEVVFVGEGPGYHEDQEGLAFVGKAGELLTKMIVAMGVDREDVFIANVVKCLSGTTLVRLADGTSERINKLVNERYSGEVLSVDPDSGLLVHKRVVGWHRSPRAGRRMFKLTYRHAKGIEHDRPSCTHLTEDHQILTTAGWVEARNAPQGVKVATGEPQPGPRTEQMVIGTLLGDGCVTRQLSIGHAFGQVEWLAYKAALLSPLEPTLSYVPQTNSVRLHTPASAYWRALRGRFYSDDKKVVPDGVPESLTDFSIAVWYLDDGYIRERTNRRPAAEIATNGYSREDVERLAAALRSRGIACRTRDASGWRIFMDGDATLELSRRIAPMTPACLRYKLHPDVRNIPFDSSFYAPEAVRTFYDEAIIEPDETSLTAGEQSLFCIDVEGTHNFVTSGGVVHNCRPPENRQPAGDEMATCLPFLQEQLEIIQPKVIVALGKTAGVGLGLIRADDSLGKNRGRFHAWRGTPVMLTYHPAYLLRTPGDKRKAWEDLQKVFPYLSRRRG